MKYHIENTGRRRNIFWNDEERSETTGIRSKYKNSLLIVLIDMHGVYHLGIYRYSDTDTGHGFQYNKNSPSERDMMLHQIKEAMNGR